MAVFCAEFYIGESLNLGDSLPILCMKADIPKLSSLRTYSPFFSFSF